MNQENLVDLLRYFSCSLVNNKESVEIDTEETDYTLTLKLKVAQEDMGRIIGKGGKTAKAIRTLMKAANDPQDKKVVVEICE